MPAKKHEFTMVEIRAGILVALSVAVLALFVAVLNGLRPPRELRVFYTFFNDTRGLNLGGDVRFGGVKQGRVSAIAPDDEDQSRIRVTFEVDKGVPVNEESRAFVTQTTLTAEPHLEITTGEQDAPLLEDGMFVPEAEGKSGGMFGALDEMAKNVAPVLEDVKKLLGVEEYSKEKAEGEEEKDLVTISDIFSNVDDAVKEGSGLMQDVRGVVGDSKEDISQILAKVKDVEDSAKELTGQLNTMLAENRQGIKSSIGGVQHVVDNVAALSDQLDEVVATLQATLNNAQSLSGEAQGFIHNNTPAIEDMVRDLQEIVRNLRAFSRTLAEEPEAIIRGKTPAGRE